MFSVQSEFTMWSLLITVFCAIFALNIWIDRQDVKKLRKKYNAEFIKEISSLQRTGLIKFFVITIILFSIIAGYSSQVRKLDSQLSELEEVISINEQIEADAQTARTAQNDGTTDILDEEKDYYPPITKDSDPTEPAPVELKSQNTIQDIYGDSNSRRSVSDIKTRYEELLATYLLMDKCGKAGQNDYKIIIASLQKEITATQAPVRLQYDTITAAKGSYDELYSRNDCSKTSDTENQYYAYIQSLSKSLQR